MRRTSKTTRGPLERMARASLSESAGCLRRIEHTCAGDVAAAAEAAITCIENGGTIYFCGNGGSAADAQHMACELSGRYLMDRPSLPAVALTTNTSSLTAIGNDFGYAQVFSRQLEGLGRRGDVLVALTTSGASQSVIRAVEVARRQGMVVIGMTGARGTHFAERCDFALVAPSFTTPRIQEGHIAMGHTLCELVERAMFTSAAAAATRARARTQRMRPVAGARGSAAKPAAKPAAAPRLVIARPRARKSKGATGRRAR